MHIADLATDLTAWIDASIFSQLLFATQAWDRRLQAARSDQAGTVTD